MEITIHNLQTLNRAYSAAFQAGLETGETMAMQFATDVPSSSAENEYSWLGQTTGFREWIGARQYQSLEEHGYAIRNKTWEDSFKVKREKIEDDLHGTYGVTSRLLGNDAKQHPDKMLFGLLQSGNDVKCYDGQYFFDTDHPVGLAGNQTSASNYGGGSGQAWYLLDNSRYLRPLIFQRRRDYAFHAITDINSDRVFEFNEFAWGADARLNVGFGMWQMAYCSRQTLDTTNYKAARAGMQSLKNDAGVPLAIRTKVLLVPPQLEGAALDIIQAESLANGATNVMRNTATVVVCPWLA
jgi:phage major head subunit gpT-like protein